MDGDFFPDHLVMGAAKADPAKLAALRIYFATNGVCHPAQDQAPQGVEPAPAPRGYPPIGVRFPAPPTGGPPRQMMLFAHPLAAVTETLNILRLPAEACIGADFPGADCAIIAMAGDGATRVVAVITHGLDLATLNAALHAMAQAEQRMAAEGFR